MKIDMLMPQMGESITEATILRWAKKVGEAVEKDDIMLEITTDKVDSEIPAPASGVITEILFNENDVVPIKSKIAVIDSEAKPSVNTTKPAAEEEETKANTSGTFSEQAYSGRFHSPLVKSLAEKHDISLNELDKVPGSGTHGRLTKEDFLRYIESKEAHKAVAVPATNTEAKDLPINQWLPDGTKRVPMDGMRRAIAKHMVHSKHTSPHVYSVQEADISKISKWRAANKEEFKKREGFNLSFTPFFLEAAIKALQEFPIVNASVDDNTIIYKKDVNLGCAVSLGNTGLIVPVIKKADEKNLVGIARSLNDLALRARDKKLNPEEVLNGTFTVTNPGIFGTMIGTPVINQPQAAILCLGVIEKRPVVVDDMIAIRERCYLTLSYDHRIIDGSVSAQFLAFICKYLSDWDMDKKLF